MKKLIFIFSLILSILILGCSSRYTYYEKPISIKKGVTKYYLKDPVVVLTLGHGAIPGDKTFASQEELTAQFKKSLTQYLSNQKILAASQADSYADLEIKIEFERIYNYGGKALNKPILYYWFGIKKDGKLLVSYNSEKGFINYGRIKEMAVMAKIIAFQRDAEAELDDVKFISEKISEQIADIGD